MSGELVLESLLAKMQGRTYVDIDAPKASSGRAKTFLSRMASADSTDDAATPVAAAAAAASTSRPSSSHVQYAVLKKDPAESHYRIALTTTFPQDGGSTDRSTILLGLAPWGSRTINAGVLKTLVRASGWFSAWAPNTDELRRLRSAFTAYTAARNEAPEKEKEAQLCAEARASSTSTLKTCYEPLYVLMKRDNDGELLKREVYDSYAAFVLAQAQRPNLATPNVHSDLETVCIPENMFQSRPVLFAALRENISLDTVVDLISKMESGSRISFTKAVRAIVESRSCGPKLEAALERHDALVQRLGADEEQDAEDAESSPFGQSAGTAAATRLVARSTTPRARADARAHEDDEADVSAEQEHEHNSDAQAETDAQADAQTDAQIQADDGQDQDQAQEHAPADGEAAAVSAAPPSTGPAASKKRKSGSGSASAASKRAHADE